ncbi:MAG TPA: protein tyrosine phosphatase [Bacteroidetes bacterium]|nr:protein tyrosine phosphatase [Bacteroidota bacterium]
MMTKILFVCTGNSARSQMAEGILKYLNPELEVFSAGTKPADQVHPLAVASMSEIGIDISKNKTKNVDEFLNQSFDFVITVCDNAKETCPVFLGNVKQRLHIGFKDPAAAMGSEEKKLAIFRKIRDEIYSSMEKFSKELNT